MAVHPVTSHQISQPPPNFPHLADVLVHLHPVTISLIQSPSTLLELCHPLCQWIVLPVIKTELHISHPMGYLHVAHRQTHIHCLVTHVCPFVTDHIRCIYMHVTAWKLWQGFLPLLKYLHLSLPMLIHKVSSEPAQWVIP